MTAAAERGRMGGVHLAARIRCCIVRVSMSRISMRMIVAVLHDLILGHLGHLDHLDAGRTNRVQAATMPLLEFGLTPRLSRLARFSLLVRGTSISHVQC